MKTKWKLLILGILVTPFFLLVSYLSGLGGHGNYYFFKILFPISSMVIFSKDPGILSLTFFFMGFLLLFTQYPIYGYIIGREFDKKKSSRYSIVILAIHALMLFFALTF